MKKNTNISCVLISIFLSVHSFAQVGISASNTTANASAMLDVSSTTKGVLFPRLSTAQRTTLGAIATDGLTVYDTDTKGYWFFDGTSWVELISSTTQNWARFSTNLYATSPFFSFAGGSIIGLINSGVGNDGTLRVFQPGSSALANYLNLDGTAIQARQNSSISGKKEMPLKLNPFGGDVGIGLGTALPSAKLHLAGNMKIDGNNTLEFGAGILGKETNAGKVGYQAFGNGDALDIIGAGTSVNNRKINLFADGGISIFGSLKMPNKVVISDYTPTEADFTILADMGNDVNKIININLPTPNASTNGRVYIITSANLPNIFTPNGNPTSGWVSVNNLSIGTYAFQSNKLYYNYKDGIPVISAYRFSLIESFTVQCINSQWRIIAQSKDIWID